MEMWSDVTLRTTSFCSVITGLQVDFFLLISSPPCPQAKACFEGCHPQKHLSNADSSCGCCVNRQESRSAVGSDGICAFTGNVVAPSSLLQCDAGSWLLPWYASHLRRITDLTYQWHFNIPTTKALGWRFQQILFLLQRCLSVEKTCKNEGRFLLGSGEVKLIPGSTWRCCPPPSLPPSVGVIEGGTSSNYVVSSHPVGNPPDPQAALAARAPSVGRKRQFCYAERMWGKALLFLMGSEPTFNERYGKILHTSGKNVAPGQPPECHDSIGSTAMGSSLFLRLAQYFHRPKIESTDVASRDGHLRKASKFTPSLQDAYRSWALSDSLLYVENFIRLLL